MLLRSFEAQPEFWFDGGKERTWGLREREMKESRPMRERERDDFIKGGGKEGSQWERS